MRRRAAVACIYCGNASGKPKLVMKCYRWNNVWPALKRWQTFYHGQRKNVWVESAEFPGIKITEDPATRFYTRTMVSDNEALQYIVSGGYTPRVVAHPISSALDDDRLQALWDEFCGGGGKDLDDYLSWLEAQHGYSVLRACVGATGIWHPKQ